MPLVADPPTLQSYLAIDSIDWARASIVLEMASDLCGSIVNPLPAEAAVVVLAVAARAFSNPTADTAETVGPYTVQRGIGSIYLTKADKATLRRLAGGGGAFSIDTMPKGVNAVQLVSITATGGTFKLNLTGQLTAPLAFNASSAAVAAALGALSFVGVGNVSVTGEGPYRIEFVNALGTTPVPLMTGDGSGLTGTAPLLTIVSTVVGVFAPGQNLAPWDTDFLQGRSGNLGPPLF